MQSAKSLTTRTRWKTLTANWPMYWGEGVGNQAAFPYSIFYFPILKIIIITLIGAQLLYNVVLVSALHQRESIYLFGCTGSSLQCAGFLVVAWRLLVAACGGLLPWAGIEPRHPALGAQSLSHWITREIRFPMFWSTHNRWFWVILT